MLSMHPFYYRPTSEVDEGSSIEEGLSEVDPKNWTVE